MKVLTNLLHASTVSTILWGILEGIILSEFGVSVEINFAILRHYTHAQWHVATNLPN